MSELPWENKKIADIMASADDGAKISDSPSSDPNKSSNPPIPDILANAFADIPMEEATMEVSGPTPKKESSPFQQSSSLPFGDLPDLSSLGANNNGEAKQDPGVPPLSSGGLPPFMGNPGASLSQDNKDAHNTAGMPIFDPSSPVSDRIEPVGPSNGLVHKRSPPPLFEPDLFSDDEIDSVSESSLPSQAPDFSLPGFQSPETPAFGEQPVVNSNPFEAPASAGVPSFGEPSVVSSNPFEAPASGGAPSFGVPSAASSNPFEAPAAGGVPSFGTPSVASSNPFEAPATGGVPSFGTPSVANSNPFEAPAAGGAPSFVVPSAASFNPFEAHDAGGVPSIGAPSVASSNPFETPASVGANPFAQSPSAAKQVSASNASNKKISKVNIDISALKKNIESLSVVARDLVRNLTMGKSLIERMDDMRAVPSRSTSVQGKKRDLAEVSSPFESESVSPFGESPVNPFDLSPKELGEESLFNEKSSGLHIEQEDNIRKITPIDNPIMATEALNPFDESDMYVTGQDSELDMPEKSSFVDSDLVNIIPVGVDAEQDIGDEVADIPDTEADGAERVVSIPENELSDTVESIIESSALSSELNAMKTRSNERLNSLESNIIDFKDNLGSIDQQFVSVQGDVEKFSKHLSELDSNFSSFVKSNEEQVLRSDSRFDGVEGKLGFVEGRIVEFESNLSVLQSDNVSIKSNLSTIENSVSELVDSYTALLVQLHESLQENESNFARIDDISVKLNEIGSKIVSIEKFQESSRATSVEFSRSISSILDGLGNTSSGFADFKQSSEKKNAEMLEKINSVTEYVENELQKLGAKSYKGFGQNVHLSNIVKNSGNMKLCMEWLEFLMELVGRNNLPDILSYYEELGWITEKVRMELLHYAEGIDFYMEKPDWKLTPDDHVKSIWFIESLAGLKVDKNKLSVIERDIEKVKKGSEIYGI